MPNEETLPANEIEIRQGSYWRARRNIGKKGDDARIPKGCMLLLISIRDVDQQAHTIILRGHPSEGDRPSEYRFLVDEFMDSFDLVPDDEARAIRNAELKGIQQEVDNIQKVIALNAQNPNESEMKAHVDAGIKEWEKKEKLKVGSTAALPMPNSAEAVALTTLTEKGVDDMKLALRRAGKVAEIQGEWMKKQSEALAHSIERMTPFFAETAAAALARTEDVRVKIDQLYKGIASLDLYVGKDVDVTEIRRGASADPEIPLSIKQSKLFMDEEVSVWCDVGEEFDFTDEKKFIEALAKNQSLADQIFPSQRCVICMAVRREDKDYGARDFGSALAAAHMNERNKAVFLLVRDGGNIFKVWSPIESHLLSGRLFPTRKEIEEIFQEKGWYDFEKHSYPVEEIKFMDTRYTDKLSHHDAVSLHYKRFMILLAGLDHRLELFGKFYTEPKGLGFISQRFMSKYMNMIADDERIALQLPGEATPKFSEWIKTRNEYLRSGSRVMGFWQNCMNQESAPGVYEKENWRMREGPRRQYDPVEDFSIQIAFREGSKVMVKVPVEGKTVIEYKERKFDASVNLSAARRDYDFGFLVLDAVKASELDYYIHNRTERVNHVHYIRLFKHAAEYLRQEEQKEKQPRAEMMRALVDGGIATGDEATEIIDKAVIAYRAAKRGAALPLVPDSDLLDQMFEISRGERRIEQAEHYARENNLIPLRLAVSGKSVMHLYCAPRREEKNDRLVPHAWVKCLTLYAQQRGLGLSNTTWKTLPLKDASETVLKDWPGVEEWAGKVSPITFNEKSRWLQIIDESRNGEAARIFGKLTETEWQNRFATWMHMRRRMQDACRRHIVVNPGCMIPVALSYKQPSEDKAPTFRVICLGTSDAALWLYHSAATDEQRAALIQEYIHIYKMKESACSRVTAKKMDVALYSFEITQIETADEFGFIDEKEMREGLITQRVTDLTETLDEKQKEWKRYSSRAVDIIFGNGWDGWTPRRHKGE